MSRHVYDVTENYDCGSNKIPLRNGLRWIDGDPVGVLFLHGLLRKLACRSCLFAILLLRTFLLVALAARAVRSGPPTILYSNFSFNDRNIR